MSFDSDRPQDGTEQLRTPQQLNREFKDVLNLFPPPSNIPVFQSEEVDSEEFLEVNPEGLERYQNRQNGELRKALFERITALGPDMHLTPSGRADLWSVLNTDFPLGIPNSDLPIEERVLKAGSMIGKYIDAKNPDSGVVFDKKTGRKIEEARYERFEHFLNSRKELGSEIRPRDLSKERWKKDLYGENRTGDGLKRLLKRLNPS